MSLKIIVPEKAKFSRMKLFLVLFYGGMEAMCLWSAWYMWTNAPDTVCRVFASAMLFLAIIFGFRLSIY